MRIVHEPALDFSDVLIQPKRSFGIESRSQIKVNRPFKFLHSETEYDSIPIIAANMDTVATTSMASALLKHNISTALHKHYSSKELIEFFTGYNNKRRSQLSIAPIFYTMGTSTGEYDKFTELTNQTHIPYVCIDNANGYTEKFNDFIKYFRENNPTVTIMAGNVVSPEMTEQLLISGADIVKCGIGSGSSCITRKVTGVGLPQLSATIECADAAHGIRGHICSDGGMTSSGDIVKAFAGGADFVMLGGMLSGHKEIGLPEIVIDDKEFYEFYGMSSSSAMEKHVGHVASYRAPEGKRVLIPAKGSVDKTINSILGGIRSACTYVGASELKELSKCTTFRLVNNQLNTIYGDS